LFTFLPRSRLHVAVGCLHHTVLLPLHTHAPLPPTGVPCTTAAPHHTHTRAYTTYHTHTTTTPHTTRWLRWIHTFCTRLFIHLVLVGWSSFTLRCCSLVVYRLLLDLILFAFHCWVRLVVRCYCVVHVRLVTAVVVSCWLVRYHTFTTPTTTATHYTPHRCCCGWSVYSLRLRSHSAFGSICVHVSPTTA